MRKYIYGIPLFIIFVIVAFWLFNHVNVWISIGYTIALGFVVAEFIIKQIKEKEKQNEKDNNSINNI